MTEAADGIDGVGGNGASGTEAGDGGIAEDLFPDKAVGRPAVG